MDDQDAPLGLTLLAAGPDDWERVRDLRLEMLADSPLAYLQRLHDAEAMTDEQWQERHRQRQAPSCFQVAVADQDRRWRGQMAVNDDRVTDRAWLVAVYLAPDLRGSKAAAAMLQACVDWTMARGRDALWLEVHEHNPRAHAFYRKHGFVDTGQRTPYGLDPTTSEVVMRLDLSGRQTPADAPPAKS